MVSKDDDINAQRHEQLGTVQIYEHLQTDEDGPIPVATHAHDRNLSINKFLREEHPDTTNQSDTWHAAKSVEKALSKVSTGAQRKHGE